MQGVVDVVLKGGQSIAKAKGHNEQLKQAKAHDEGGFPLMALCYVEFVKGGNDVQLCVDFGIA